MWTVVICYFHFKIMNLSTYYSSFTWAFDRLTNIFLFFVLNLANCEYELSPPVIMSSNFSPTFTNFANVWTAYSMLIWRERKKPVNMKRKKVCRPWILLDRSRPFLAFFFIHSFSCTVAIVLFFFSFSSRLSSFIFISTESTKHFTLVNSSPWAMLWPQWIVSVSLSSFSHDL